MADIRRRNYDGAVRRRKLYASMSEEELIRQVKQDPFVISDIENPSEDVQIAAVIEDGRSIKFIENPSERVQLAAIRNTRKPASITDIKDPYESVRRYCGGFDGGRPSISPVDESLAPSSIARLLSEDVRTNNGFLFEAVDDSSGRQHRANVRQHRANESAIRERLNNKSEEEQIAIVRDYGAYIKYIDNPSERVKIAAVENEPKIIHYIKNPSVSVQLAAVEKDGWALFAIKNPSERVQIAAVQQDRYVINHIMNPSDRVRRAARGENWW